MQSWLSKKYVAKPFRFLHISRMAMILALLLYYVVYATWRILSLARSSE